MATGLVKWFNESKGFGFIASENKEFFVHFSEIVGSGFKTIHENDKVEFTPGTNAKGPCATQVKVIHE